MNQEPKAQTQNDINNYTLQVCLTMTNQINQLVDCINKLDQRVTALERETKVQTVTHKV
jgi:DNA-binding transcriptional regulator WhiA